MTLTATQELKLARLYNRRTAYELVAEKGEQRILIAYSTNKGRLDIMNCIRNRVAAWMHLTNATELTFAKRARDGASTTNGWRVYWSGRTQREAIIAGELDYIEDLAHA